MSTTGTRGSPRRSPRPRARLYVKGRQLSPMGRKLGPIGVDLIGWAELLNRGGYGPDIVKGGLKRKGPTLPRAGGSVGGGLPALPSPHRALPGPRWQVHAHPACAPVVHRGSLSRG